MLRLIFYLFCFEFKGIWLVCGLVIFVVIVVVIIGLVVLGFVIDIDLDLLFFYLVVFVEG